MGNWGGRGGEERGCGRKKERITRHSEMTSTSKGRKMHTVYDPWSCNGNTPTFHAPRSITLNRSLTHLHEAVEEALQRAVHAVIVALEVRPPDVANDVRHELLAHRLVGTAEETEEMGKEVGEGDHLGGRNEMRRKT